MRIINSAFEGKAIEFEWLHSRYDGTIFPAEVRLNKLELDGRPHLQAIIRDISDRKSLEVERNRIVTDLIQRNKDLEQFSYMVSHNLRAPVANIISISDYMMNFSLSPEDLLELNKGLHNSVSVLDGVVKDMNNILQTGKHISEQKTVVSLTSVIDNLKVIISELIDAEKVHISTDFSSIDEVLSIKSYLHSIMINLITNSIKYKQPSINPIIEITSKRVNDGVEIVYQDNGIGIDLEKYGTQVFGLYKRFHHHADGKGLGLYMVKTQVEALNGTITIESRVNEGTRFNIQFPNV